MGSFSIWHWMIVLVIVLLLFGRGRIADIMGDMAKGVKSFKRGLADDEQDIAAKAALEHRQTAAATTTVDDKTKAV